MATTILAQTVEYDNSARAWAQLDSAGSLIRYHDSQDEAMLASLPADLQTFILSHSGGNGASPISQRHLRAACYILEQRLSPLPETPGGYRVHGHAATYTVDVRQRACSCRDRAAGNYCKHLLAGSYLYNQFLIQSGDRTLYTRALVALQDNPGLAEHQIVRIWQDASGTRYAWLMRLRETVYLHVSGNRAELGIARCTPHGYALVADWYAYMGFVDECKAQPGQRSVIENALKMWAIAESEGDPRAGRMVDYYEQMLERISK